MDANAWKGLCILIGVCVFGYLFFFHEDEEYRHMKKACAEKGTTVETRPNAVQIFGYKNTHYACRGYDFWGKKQ